MSGDDVGAQTFLFSSRLHLDFLIIYDVESVTVVVGYFNTSIYMSTFYDVDD